MIHSAATKYQYPSLLKLEPMVIHPLGLQHNSTHSKPLSDITFSFHLVCMKIDYIFLNRNSAQIYFLIWLLNVNLFLRRVWNLSSFSCTMVDFRTCLTITPSKSGFHSKSNFAKTPFSSDTDKIWYRCFVFSACSHLWPPLTESLTSLSVENPYIISNWTPWSSDVLPQIKVHRTHRSGKIF